MEKDNQRLINEKDKICNNIDNNKKELESYKNQLNDIQNNISKTLENQKELSQKAFENYCEILEKNYNEKEKEYDMYEQGLCTAYSNLQLELIQKADKCRKELAQIEATRAAAIQAKIKEQ